MSVLYIRLRTRRCEIMPKCAIKVASVQKRQPTGRPWHRDAGRRPAVHRAAPYRGGCADDGVEARAAERDCPGETVPFRPPWLCRAATIGSLTEATAEFSALS